MPLRTVTVPTPVMADAHINLSGSTPDGAANYATAALFFTNFVAYLDRSILTLFVEPVKTALRLTDGQVGLLLGAAFVLTFTVAGLFMGRLVDRVNRRNLLMVCVVIWTVSTAATGLAGSATEMFIARMGVGVGEAALFPTAVSLFADHFPPEKRGRPYGIFTTGVYAGGGASLILIGAMLPAVTKWSGQLAADDYSYEPWRLVMFAMVVPGILCTLALWLMREPVRAVRLSQSDHHSTQSGLSSWFELRRIFLPHHLAIATITLGLYGLNAWLPTALIRDHGYSPRNAGLLFGVVVAATGISGAIIGGIAADRASRRAGILGRWQMVAVCTALGAVGYVVIGVSATPAMILAGSVIASAPMGAAIIAGIMTMSDLSPERARGQITGVYFVFAGVIGTAGGPALVGYLSDLLRSSGVSLSTIIGAVGLAASLVGLLFSWFTYSAMQRTPLQRPSSRAV